MLLEIKAREEVGEFISNSFKIWYLFISMGGGLIGEQHSHPISAKEIHVQKDTYVCTADVDADMHLRLAEMDGCTC